jgi:putative phosphoesterase
MPATAILVGKLTNSNIDLKSGKRGKKGRTGGHAVKIAVLSDSHSRYENVAKALRLLEGHGVELILHCGDIDDAETVWLFPGNTHFVFGNCDHERASMRQAIHGIGGTLHEPWGHLELAGKDIAFLHGDDQELQRDLERSEAFDYLFHGHTHVAADRRAGRTRVINPGALHRARPKTFIVLDLASGEVESLALE